MPDGRRSRGTQRGMGIMGKSLFQRFNLEMVDGDPTGFFRTENTPAERPWAYLPTLPAIGARLHINLWQFNNAYCVNTTNVWTEAAVGTGTGLTIQDARGGVAKFINGASDNDYYTYFSKYEVAKLVAGKGLWLHGIFNIADVDQADWFFGLTALLGSGNLFDNRVDAVGFYGADGSANINCECTKNSTATQSTGKGTLTDSTDKEFLIYANGTSAVYFYLSNASGRLDYVATITTNLNDDETMAVAFGLRNGQASANNMTTGRVLLLQDV